MYTSAYFANIMKKCLNLQPEMKNLGTRIFAFMLVVWYCLSIIGFGVHTCSVSKRAFLTSFISGVECADIHPSEMCKASCCSADKHKSCCGHHSSEKNDAEHSDTGVKVTKKTCCSNAYQQIELTGSGHVSVSEQSVSPQTLIAVCVNSSSEYNNVTYSRMIQARTLPDRDLYMGELRPLLSVWRI